MFYINKLKNSCNWNKNIPFYKQIVEINEFNFQNYILVKAYTYIYAKLQEFRKQFE